MIVKYSEGDLLNLFRYQLGLPQSRRSATTKNYTRMDRKLLSILRSRYLRMLATEPPALLPLADIGSLCTLTPAGPNAYLATVPDSMMQPVSVRLSLWERPVYRFHDPGSVTALRQQYPLLRATHRRPVAVRTPSGFILHGLPADAAMPSGTLPTLSLEAVTLPADGSFIFAPQLFDRLLNTKI